MSLNTIAVLALYGAILSTIGILISWREHKRNSASLLIDAQFGGHRDGGFFIYFTIVNTGRRPTMVNDVRLITQKRKLEGELSLQLKDLPIMLHEGEVYNGKIEFSKIKNAFDHEGDRPFSGLYAVDSLGREWYVPNKYLDFLIQHKLFEDHLEKGHSMETFISPFRRRPKIIHQWWRAIKRWPSRRSRYEDHY